MKIQNSSLVPLSTKPTENTGQVDKKEELSETSSARSGQDSVEMSENARLLAKARTALGNVGETNSGQLLKLKDQIMSGDYTVQIRELATKLAARFLPK